MRDLNMCHGKFPAQGAKISIFNEATRLVHQRWSDWLASKKLILAELAARGAEGSAVARRHGFARRPYCSHLVPSQGTTEPVAPYCL